MVSADENRPIAGSGQRSGKQGSGKQGSGKPERPGKKADKQRSKQAQKPDMKPDAPLRASPVPVEVLEVPMEAPEVPREALEALPEAPEQAPEQTDLPVASTENPAAFAAASDTSPTAPAPVTPAESVPVSVQTIAKAYGSYTAKSLEQTRSYFEQLARVRSFNKAFELQTEFAQQAYQTFMAESQKIRELHSELAKQRLRSLQGFVTGKNITRST
jgi:hypothetical protein